MLIQSFLKSAQWFLERRFLKKFLPYMGKANKLSFPLPKEAPHLALIGRAVLEKMLNIVNDGPRTPEHG